MDKKSTYFAGYAVYDCVYGLHFRELKRINERTLPNCTILARTGEVARDAIRNACRYTGASP